MALIREPRTSELLFDGIQTQMLRLNNVVWYGSAQHLIAIENQVENIKNDLNHLVVYFQEEHQDQFPPKELPDSKLMNKQDKEQQETLPLETTGNNESLDEHV